MTTTVGETLRQARVDKRLSLRELAHNLSLHPQHLNDIEHDRSLPSNNTLTKAARHLGLDAAALSRQRDNPPPLTPLYSIRFETCVIHRTECAAQARAWYKAGHLIRKGDRTTLGTRLDNMPAAAGCGSCTVCTTERTCRECDTLYQLDDDIHHCDGCDTWICTTCNDWLTIPEDHQALPQPADGTFCCRFCQP